LLLLHSHLTGLAGKLDQHLFLVGLVTCTATVNNKYSVVTKEQQGRLSGGDKTIKER
jgi:hypothetical protein